MNETQAPYGRLERLLDRIDFTWRASGLNLHYIDEQGIWMQRFRPSGPHGLWIAGHLAFYEAGVFSVQTQSEGNDLADWKALFGNGSECFDDPTRYADPTGILNRLESGRAALRERVASYSEADLDRPVSENARLKIRDVQSQLEFMVWHDSHHAAQLGAIVNNHKSANPG